MALRILFLILLLLAQPVSAQIIPTDITTTWAPGLTYGSTGIPSKASRPCGTTITAASLGNGTTDAATTIQNAINAAAANTAVCLGAGVFRLDTSNPLVLKSNVTLRGAGANADLTDESANPDSNRCRTSQGTAFWTSGTCLYKTNGAVIDQDHHGEDTTEAIVIGPNRFAGLDGSVSVNLSANCNKGAMSCSVSSGTGFVAGQFVMLDVNEYDAATFIDLPNWNDAPSNTDIWCSDRMCWSRRNPTNAQDDPFPDSLVWFSRSKRNVNEIKRIASVSGTTITFTTPVHENYTTARSAQLTRYNYTHVTGAGVEDISFWGFANGTVNFGISAWSWIRDCQIEAWYGEGVNLNHSFGNEVRENYIHNAAFPSPGGMAYAISIGWGSSEAYIFDNIIEDANKMMVARAAGTASVIAYNYAEDGNILYDLNFQEVGINGSHMAGPHHMLFEGNYSFNYDSDNTHGSSFAMTVFRNRLTGVRKSYSNDYVSGSAKAVGLNYGSYRHAFVGNILGMATGQSSWLIDNLGNGSAADDPFRLQQPYGSIWKIGYQSGFWYQDVDTLTRNSVRRGGNYILTQGVGLTWNEISAQTIPNSMYLPGTPTEFGTCTFPWVNPNTGTTYNLPAKDRIEAGQPFVPQGCAAGVVPPTGTTHYVSPLGNDSNSCDTATTTTQTNNKLTIAAGVACLTAGETLRIRAGTYTGSNAVIDSQTKVVNPGTNWTTGAITIEAYPGETVRLQPPNATSAIRLTSNLGGGSGSPQYIIFKNIIFDGINTTCCYVDVIYQSGPTTHIRYDNIESVNSWQNGIHFGDETEFNEVLNSRIHNNRDAGEDPRPHCLYITASNNLFDGNEVYNCQGYGFHLYNNTGNDPGGTHAHPSNNIVRNNRVHNNGLYGSAAYCITITWGTSNLVYNNFCYEEGYGGIQTYTDARNTKIFNNTIYSVDTECIAMQYSFDNGTTAITEVKNNICYANGDNTVRNYGVTGTPQVSNNLFTDPGFVNAGLGQFKLSAQTSAAVDAGVSGAAYFTTDFEGQTRTGTWDIGADEYGDPGGGGPPTDINYATGTVFITDTMTGTAGTNLTAHTGEVGATWAKQSGFTGNFVLSDAGRARTSDAGAHSYYASGPALSSEYDVSVTYRVFSLDTNNINSIGCRMASGSFTGIILDYEIGSASWKLYRYVSGTPTMLGSFAQTLTVGNSYTVMLQCRNTAIAARVDGTTIIYVADTGLVNSNPPGLLVYNPSTAETNSTGIHFDAFSARDVTATVTPIPTATGVTFVTDTFTGTAGTLLTSGHAGEVGGSWAKQIGITGDPVITDANRIRNADLGSTMIYASGTPISNEYDVTADLRVFSIIPGNFNAIACRVDPAVFSSIVLEYDATNARFLLLRFNSGVQTELSPPVSYTLTPGSTYAVRLQCRNATIGARVNDVPIFYVTDTGGLVNDDPPGILAYVSATAETNATGIHVDNFGARDVSAAPITAIPLATGTLFVSDTMTGTAGTNLTAHTGETGATWAKKTGVTGDFFLTDANRVRMNVAGSGAPPAYVTACDNVSYAAGTTTACTFTANVAVDDWLIMVACNNETRTSTLGDSVGLTWTARQTFIDGSAYCRLWDARVTSGGTSPTVTVTWSGSLTGAGLISGHAVRGINTSTPYNAGTYTQGCFPSTGTDIGTSGNFTTTVNGTYNFGIAVNYIGPDLWTAGTGFTGRTSQTASMLRVTEDRIQATAGATAATFSLSASTGTCYVIFGAGYAPAATGGGGGTATYLPSGTPSTSEYDVEADLRVFTVVPGSIEGFMCRMSPTVASYISIVYDQDLNRFELGKSVTGTYTVLGTAAYTLTPGSTYRVTLQCRATEIGVRINNVPILYAADSALINTDRPALSSFVTLNAPTNTTGLHWDNITARNFAVTVDRRTRSMTTMLGRGGQR